MNTPPVVEGVGAEAVDDMMMTARVAAKAYLLLILIAALTFDFLSFLSLV